jgi:pimeloyl-ACP methyl ester carboxylesterase
MSYVGVALALAALLSLTPAAQAQTCEPAGHPRATVLVIWSPWGSQHECDWFARRGYRAVLVNGTPGVSWTEDWDELLAKARAAPRPRYAYGWSHAGTVAELLALRGEVDGAIATGAPSDLTRWAPVADFWEGQGVSAEERRRLSPLYHVPGDRRVPLLLVHSTQDEIVPFWHSRRLHRRVPGSELVRLHRHHGLGVERVHWAATRFLTEALGAGPAK